MHAREYRRERPDYAGGSDSMGSLYIKHYRLHTSWNAAIARRAAHRPRCWRDFNIVASRWDGTLIDLGALFRNMRFPVKSPDIYGRSGTNDYIRSPGLSVPTVETHLWKESGVHRSRSITRSTICGGCPDHGRA